jgi:Domain of unknown function (DUF4398)
MPFPAEQAKCTRRTCGTCSRHGTAPGTCGTRGIRLRSRPHLELRRDKSALARTESWASYGATGPRHLRHLPSSFYTHRVLRVLPLLLLLAACASPPSKEMDQAQGAIDGARAAGAEEYAQTELSAAVDSLKRSEEAVAQRDYRLALNLAIESRSRAQNAAKAAVAARTKARGDAERLVAEADVLLAQARERLNHPDLSRLPRRVVQEQRDVIAAAEKSMQDARAALKADDYARVIKSASGVAPQIRAALKALTEPSPPRPAKRRR